MPSITTINLSSAAGELSRASTGTQAANRAQQAPPSYIDQVQIQKIAQIANVQLKRTDESPTPSLPNFVERGNGSNKKRAKGDSEEESEVGFESGSDSGDENDSPVKVDVVA